MTEPPVAADVLGRAVLVNDELVGYVSGVFLDVARSRPIGLEVTSAARARRFLPWVAVTRRGRELVAASAFLLYESCQPYLEHGAVLCRERGELADLASRGVSRAVAAGIASS